MTYASTEGTSGTAPGQIPSSDLRDIFRVKDLDKDTGVYGIIAGDTSYSLSPYIHNPAFKQAGINSVFIPLQTDDVGDFLRRMVRRETREVELNFRGFSVTNPHKLAIIEHLDDVDETARAIGAVNTVKIDGEKLRGYNTDAPGFIEPLRAKVGDLRDVRVAVAGAGGAARACVYSLNQEGADVTVLARDPSSASGFSDEFGVRIAQVANDHRALTSFDILVNATPLGTRGANIDETVATADELRHLRLVYDLVYNPSETRLIQEAKAAGVATLGGLEMLVAQAALQFKIWTGKKAPLDVMKAAVTRRLK
jgi:shikimate dehydrogenase